jgi:hypothetical protein
MNPLVVPRGLGELVDMRLGQPSIPPTHQLVLAYPLLHVLQRIGRPWAVHRPLFNAKRPKSDLVPVRSMPKCTIW